MPGMHRIKLNSMVPCARIQGTHTAGMPCLILQGRRGLLTGWKGPKMAHSHVARSSCACYTHWRIRHTGA